MLTLKTIAQLFPGFVTIMAHGSGLGCRMSAGNINPLWEDKIVTKMIPLDNYVVEITVED